MTIPRSASSLRQPRASFLACRVRAGRPGIAGIWRHPANERLHTAVASSIVPPLPNRATAEIYGRFWQTRDCDRGRDRVARACSGRGGRVRRMDEMNDEEASRADTRYGHPPHHT